MDQGRLRRRAVVEDLVREGGNCKLDALQKRSQSNVDGLVRSTRGVSVVSLRSAVQRRSRLTEDAATGRQEGWSHPSPHQIFYLPEMN